MPRPYCATAPDITSSVTILTRVPASIDSSVDSIVACTPPRFFSSRAFTDSSTRCDASSTCSSVTSVSKMSPMAPSLTLIVAFQCVSSTTCFSSAPGMHGTTLGTSTSVVPDALGASRDLEGVL
jgi:hypothetical protein